MKKKIKQQHNSIGSTKVQEKKTTSHNLNISPNISCQLSIFMVSMEYNQVKYQSTRWGSMPWTTIIKDKMDNDEIDKIKVESSAPIYIPFGKWSLPYYGLPYKTLFKIFTKNLKKNLKNDILYITQEVLNRGTLTWDWGNISASNFL